MESDAPKKVKGPAPVKGKGKSKKDKLREKLKNVENVVEAQSVYGVYDIVVKVEADTMDKLKDVVHQKIRSFWTQHTAHLARQSI